MKNASAPLQWGILAAVLLCAFSAQANPISIPEKPLAPEISLLVSFSILLESACVIILLRHFRKPFLFVLWVLGLHVITYPVFLGIVWLLSDLRPALTVALGEGSIVIIEGTLIYLICRFMPVRKNLPMASPLRCWFVSFAGNSASFIAFPLLLRLSELISRHF